MEINHQQKLAALLRSAQHPLRKDAETLVAHYLQDMNGQLEHENTPVWYATGKIILQSSPEAQSHILLHILTVGSPRLDSLRKYLLQQNLVFNDDQMIELLSCWAINSGCAVVSSDDLVPHLKRYRQSVSKIPTLVGEILKNIRERIENDYTARVRVYKHFLSAIEESLDEHLTGRLPQDRGEAWVQAVVAYMDSLIDGNKRTSWGLLFRFCLTADSSKPSKEWSKHSHERIIALGDDFVPLIARWLSLVSLSNVSSTYDLSDGNIGFLKGLAWCCAGRTEPEIARALEKLTLSCLAKVPGTGPWAVRAANAAVLRPFRISR